MNYSHIYGVLLAGALCCTSSAAFAQSEEEQQEAPKGWLSASFETNTIVYRNDKTVTEIPDDRIGSNNYLKLDYTKGRFSTGMQLESYLPVLQGYPSELEGTKITNIYAQWADRDFTITAGTFYDQFGSGLLFRTWEDRTLGLNNALLGARATYTYGNILNIKVLWGTPHLGMSYETGTQVRGADASIGLGNIFGWQNASLDLEGSVLSTFQEIPNSYSDYVDANKVGYSGRINFGVGGFSAKLEYVDNGKSYYQEFRDDGSNRTYFDRKGSAQLLELGFNHKGLGIFATGRRLEWMQSQIQTIANPRPTTSINILNYIPAMSVQHTYLLTNIKPYTPQIGEINPSPNGVNLSGEIGGQIDVFYSFRKGTTLGGKRGLKIHANFANYYTLKEGKGDFKAQNLLYRDFNVDFEKWLSKRLKLSMLYTMQEINSNYGMSDKTYLSHVVVADMLYKFNSEYSLRWELQYLASKDNMQDWVAALVEFNVAPKWSIFASDMWNFGNNNVAERTHYYNAGISFAQSRTRMQLSYGRNRAGFVCSGGVCRTIPAYTGFNFTMTISF